MRASCRGHRPGPDHHGGQRQASVLLLLEQRVDQVAVGAGASAHDGGADAGGSGGDGGVVAEVLLVVVDAEGGLGIDGAGEAVAAFGGGGARADAAVGVDVRLVGDHLGAEVQAVLELGAQRRVEGREGRGKLVGETLGDGDGLAAALGALVGGDGGRGLEERAEVEGQEVVLEVGGSVVEPGGGELAAEAEEDAGGAGGGGGRGQGEGVEDLGGFGGVLGVEAVEGGEDGVEEDGGVVVGAEEGVEAGEGGMVGAGGKEGETDKPAGEEIGGEQVLELRVRAGAVPGAQELGAQEEGDGVGGGRSGAILVMEGGAGADDGGEVEDGMEADKGVLAAAEEEGVHDERGEPGEDGLQPAQQERADQRRDGGQRQIGLVTVGVRW